MMREKLKQETARPRSGKRFSISGSVHDECGGEIIETIGFERGKEIRKGVCSKCRKRIIISTLRLTFKAYKS